ncbi:MAG: hypothetical protein WC758_07840 [Candidatus Woesearchaeota archaeon]|jgi:hypothetical protein
MGLFKFLEKSEEKYLIFTSVFAFFYFLILLPAAIKYFDFKNIFMQFLLLNIGLLFVINLFLKYAALNKKPKLRNVLGIMVMIFAISIWTPPYSTLMSGLQAVPSENGPATILAASDYVIGFFWNHVAGITGGFTLPNFIPYISGTFISWTFLLTYIISPLGLLFLSSKLQKDFVRNV